MYVIQSIRNKLFNWRRARSQVVEFRKYSPSIPFIIVQERLGISSLDWNFSQEHHQSQTGYYIPAARMYGRICSREPVTINRHVIVRPEAFIGFNGLLDDPCEFVRSIPANSEFRAFIVEVPDGASEGGFPTFQELLPHVRAGLRGRIDSRGILRVSDVILHGRVVQCDTWWPQRRIMRVLNMFSEVVRQISTGVPYEPAKAQRSAWRASARLPSSQPPYFKRMTGIRRADREGPCI